MLRKCIQSKRVYKIFEVKVIFIQFCKTKTILREVSAEFKHYHYIQESLQKIMWVYCFNFNIEKSYLKSTSLIDFESKSYIYSIL